MRTSIIVSAIIEFILYGITGKMIRTLTCLELTNTKSVHDISLSEDGTTLALACRDDGVKLFTDKRHSETGTVFSD